MSEPIIQVQGLRKRFGKTPVLKGIDLSIPRGTVVGLLGKNGAGKSTLIKCLLGLLRASDGKVQLFNEDSWTLSALAKARLGYVPQEISLYPWMKVRNVVEYTAAFYPNWNQPFVEDLLDRWEVSRDSRVGPLSVGEMQKLALILALGHEPELLILDEPVASLDPTARREFLKEMLEIAADANRTVLYSTHITSDLERVADHVVILRDGQVIYDDELDELKDSVKRIRLTAADSFPASFSVAGSLRCEVQDNEAMVAIRGIDGDMVDELRSTWHAEIDVQDLNLEEIFLELHDA